MVFNIDEDPINANWLRWKNWDISISTLNDLLRFLGIENDDRQTQVKQLSRLSDFYDRAPQQLKDEVAAFLKS